MFEFFCFGPVNRVPQDSWFCLESLPNRTGSSETTPSSVFPSARLLFDLSFLKTDFKIVSPDVLQKGLWSCDKVSLHLWFGGSVFGEVRQESGKREGSCWTTSTVRSLNGNLRGPKCGTALRGSKEGCSRRHALVLGERLW